MDVISDAEVQEAIAELQPFYDSLKNVLNSAIESGSLEMWEQALRERGWTKSLLPLLKERTAMFAGRKEAYQGQLRPLLRIANGTHRILNLLTMLLSSSGFLTSRKPQALYEQLGAQLRRMREDAGLSEAELAETLGTTRASVNHFEHARRWPSIDKLAKWADACGSELILTFRPLGALDGEEMPRTNQQRAEREGSILIPGADSSPADKRHFWLLMYLMQVLPHVPDPVYDLLEDQFESLHLRYLTPEQRAEFFNRLAERVGGPEKVREILEESRRKQVEKLMSKLDREVEDDEEAAEAPKKE